MHDKWRIEVGDIATALALLTRLPVRASFSRGAKAAWAYPLVGLVVATLAAVPTGIALAVGLPATLAALIWVAGSVILTGAMHEDGLADCADGFWGGWDRARRLEIMKDSQIGSYGVIALCLSLVARWIAVSMILQEPAWLAALIGVAVASRATMPALMTALPHARDTGLSQSQGRPVRETAAVAAVLAIAALVLTSGGSTFGLIVVAALTALACFAIAKSKIGGQTGDVLGATQQLTEVALLMALAI
ncbi:adenosylcobinamide-GDP ribazoletransferase [Shimia sediminis]|uniref:adenosylcobinamide-GDP ribazoletransferase n=1 Tax=Shimia sediminis TaxID=2497945 RepID=UPI000F8DF9D1|nr:adenosylcobinamide-GDP ribazoletransferase [Shimia sediminis]